MKFALLLSILITTNYSFAKTETSDPIQNLPTKSKITFLKVLELDSRTNKVILVRNELSQCRISYRSIDFDRYIGKDESFLLLSVNFDDRDGDLNFDLTEYKQQNLDLSCQRFIETSVVPLREEELTIKYYMNLLKDFVKIEIAPIQSFKETLESEN